MRFDTKASRLRSRVAIPCMVILVSSDTLAYALQASAAQGRPSNAQLVKLAPEQLDSLVAPIVLYPDPLLAQVLSASTYPLEIVLLQRWLETNKNLKDKQLADAAAKQPWDLSVNGSSEFYFEIPALRGRSSKPNDTQFAHTFMHCISDRASDRSVFDGV